jgi:hypothetical protein
LARLEPQTKHSLSLFSRGETLFLVIQIKKTKQEGQAIDYQPSASLVIFVRTAAGFLCKSVAEGKVREKVEGQQYTRRVEIPT